MIQDPSRISQSSPEAVEEEPKRISTVKVLTVVEASGYESPEAKEIIAKYYRECEDESILEGFNTLMGTNDTSRSMSLLNVKVHDLSLKLIEFVDRDEFMASLEIDLYSAEHDPINYDMYNELFAILQLAEKHYAEKDEK